jgi:hypothetical protein
METREFREELEIALSGGGYRASAFGLGALLYLAHSGLNQKVKSIVSVSGGSITNGFVATECDFGSETNPENFRRIAARLAQIISGGGRFRGFWFVSRPYMAALILSGVALGVWLASVVVALIALAAWGVDLRPVSLKEVLLLALAAVLWGTAALNRGNLVLWWLGRTFFRERPTLGSLSGRTVDHVFCSTDLTSSRPFFLSTKGGGRVFSEVYGRGDGKAVSLRLAVGASAAFPPLIPPLRMTLRGLPFHGDGRVPGYIYLSDGGVWNNLGTDWSRLRVALVSAEVAWYRKMTVGKGVDAIIWSVENCPTGGVLLIVNASKPEKQQNLWLLKIPFVSFIVALIRVVNVTVNSTVEARSADLERTARMRMLNDPDRWELGADAPRPQSTVWGEGRGTDPPLSVAVEMTRKPGETANAYRMIGGLAQWEERPDAYVEELGDSLRGLAPLLEGEEIVPTTLDNLGPRDTLRMIVLGYLNARETLAVAFANHEPPAIPEREWFEDLLDAGGRLTAPT